MVKEQAGACSLRFFFFFSFVLLQMALLMHFAFVKSTFITHILIQIHFILGKATLLTNFQSIKFNAMLHNLPYCARFKVLQKVVFAFLFSLPFLTRNSFKRRYATYRTKLVRNLCDKEGRKTH